jgi:hypothetical protein
MAATQIAIDMKPTVLHLTVLSIFADQIAAPSETIEAIIYIAIRILLILFLQIKSIILFFIPFPSFCSPFYVYIMEEQ